VNLVEYFLKRIENGENPKDVIADCDRTAEKIKLSLKALDLLNRATQVGHFATRNNQNDRC
jgi:hypothetical protein